jgi:hypothetical protein
MSQTLHSGAWLAHLSGRKDHLTSKQDENIPSSGWGMLRLRQQCYIQMEISRNQ